MPLVQAQKWITDQVAGVVWHDRGLDEKSISLVQVWWGARMGTMEWRKRVRLDGVSDTGLRM